MMLKWLKSGIQDLVEVGKEMWKNRSATLQARKKRKKVKTDCWANSDCVDGSVGEFQA